MTATSPLARAILDALRSDPAACAELADLLAPPLWKRVEAPTTEPRDGWLNTKRAADYLGITANALHKIAAARLVPVEQDGPGCKLWFRQAELDRWREHGGARGTRAADRRRGRVRAA